ncbi:MAG: alpha/beta fold hydrolase [Syntrophomonadaceae bacterium]|jgi:carboxylesterase|nr:alpha/beta fold hydrolase [Syntrophomonadaceae bacterium]
MDKLSFFLTYAENQRTALLFVHGFTATPSELYPAARIIYETGGINVMGVLLPGHGSNPGQLNKTSWRDWYREVNDKIDFLKRKYQKVFVAGLSMGALLALAAGERRRDLTGVILINIPAIFKDKKINIPLITMLSWFKKCWPKKDEKEFYTCNGRYAYPCYPLKALKSLLKGRKKILKNASAVTASVLIVQSGEDEMVEVAGAEYLRQKLVNADTKIMYLPNSHHIATMEAEKEVLAQAVIDFIKRNR